MITQHKWNTPYKDFREAALIEARTIFNYCIIDIEKGKWTRTGMSRDYRGYSQTLRQSEYFSAMGLVLRNFLPYTGAEYADETLEIIITILGSEANKMGYTSVREVEIHELSSGITTLFERCSNSCMGIIVDKRTEANIPYEAQLNVPFVTKSGKELTEEDIEGYVKEAEEGYDVEKLVDKKLTNEAALADEASYLIKGDEVIEQAETTDTGGPEEELAE